MIGQADLAAGQIVGEREITVAFADLVDWTKLGEQVPVEELGGVAGRLEEMAAAVAEPPVQVIKQIGDAVMLVSNEAEPMLDAALGLIDVADQEGEEFPQLRAGVAHGPALPQSGDWYGRTVNLASRITGIARPSSVLVDEAARDAAGEAFSYSFARERRLKGIDGRVKLFRARRAPRE